ncbi:MAG: GspH/FimT family protein, partial [Thermodesulfobacteriota bacterium]
KAIMTNRRVVVNFDAAANSFTAFVDENADGALDAGELTIADRTMPAGINLTTNLVDTVTAAAVAEVTFDSQGIPTASGTMTVQNSSGNDQDIRLYLSGHTVLE